MPALTAAESPCSQPPWSVWETLLSGSHLLPLTLTGFLPSPMTILDSREGCDTGVPFWGKHFLLCDIFRGRERSGGDGEWQQLEEVIWLVIFSSHAESRKREP